MKVETREVLADAYLRGTGSMLSHAVEINEHGPVRALCGRVRVGSIADRYASDPDATPTCATCRRKDPRAEAQPSSPLSSETKQDHGLRDLQHRASSDAPPSTPSDCA